MSPPSLNLSHCPLVVSPLLFARCVAIGESGFASSHIFIYSELNRHGISRKRENAEHRVKILYGKGESVHNDGCLGFMHVFV